MDLFAVDDSRQKRPTRKGMGSLVAVGGLHVPSQSIRKLELGLDAICSETGFPVGHEFKWSPDSRSWMRKNLKFEARESFFHRCLDLATELEATAFVVVEDAKYKPAIRASANAQEDVVTLFLERAHNHLRSTDTEALVVADHPSGGRPKESEFLASCLETLRRGTTFVVPDRLALVMTSDSRLVRLLQLADLIVGCTLAHVGGEDKYSPPVFEKIKALLRSDSDRIGGVRLKIHPDIRYANLYHWLLGDDVIWKNGVGAPSPNGWL